MTIATLPSSPSGEISHGQVRTKVNEVVSHANTFNNRLSTVRSLDLVFDGNEQIIAFDPAQTSRAIGLGVNVAGNLLSSSDGYFQGALSLFIDKSGGVLDISVWVEIKPVLAHNGYTAGVWNLASPGMSDPSVAADGGQSALLLSTVDILDGDEVRIKIQMDAGTGKLTSMSKVKALGTVTDFAASLTVISVGPITP